MKSTDILVRRCARVSLQPIDEDGETAILKIPDDETFAIRIMRHRSMQQNRLYWKMLTHIAQATKWGTPEKLHVALKVKLGRYDVVPLPNGKAVVSVDSAAFDAMSQDDFQRYFDDAVRELASAGLLDDEAQRMLGPPPAKPEDYRATTETSPPVARNDGTPETETREASEGDGQGADRAQSPDEPPASPQPEPIREIVPSRFRGQYQWPGYAAAILAAYRELPPERRQDFRNAQARYLRLYRSADLEAQPALMTAMAEIDQES